MPPDLLLPAAPPLAPIGTPPLPLLPPLAPPAAEDDVVPVVALLPPATVPAAAVLPESLRIPPLPLVPPAPLPLDPPGMPPVPVLPPAPPSNATPVSASKITPSNAITMTLLPWFEPPEICPLSTSVTAKVKWVMWPLSMMIYRLTFFGRAASSLEQWREHRDSVPPSRVGHRERLFDSVACSQGLVFRPA
jgi:hypothetical protein